MEVQVQVAKVVVEINLDQVVVNQVAVKVNLVQVEANQVVVVVQAVQIGLDIKRIFIDNFWFFLFFYLLDKIDIQTFAQFFFVMYVCAKKKKKVKLIKIY